MLITILILVLLVVYYILGTDYLKQRKQKETLGIQISEGTATLALIPQPPADLDEQLADAQDSLWVIKDTLNIDTNITRIVNRILRLGDETGVKAIPLSTQPWIIERISNQNYSVFRIDLAITGNFTQMAEFLNRLENGEPNTLILEYVKVEKLSGSFLFESPAEGPTSADIRVAVYAPAAID
jgi:Tfp pilus assembly protein PilO